MWLGERKPETLRQAAVLADDYVLARKGEGRTPPHKFPVPTQTGGGARPMDDRNSSPLRRYERPGQNAYGGRPQTNAKGERKCFQCNRYGHLMYDCPFKPSSTTSATSKALFGSVCHDMAWDKSSQKHQCWGSVNEKPARMLVDTGCDMTMVSVKWVDPEEVDRQNTVPVLCVHGDTMRYLTASIALRVGKKKQIATVAVAPDLPVPVLLGRDVWSLETNPEKKSELMVVTRSQKQRETERSHVSPNLEETSTPTGQEEDPASDQTPVDEQRREADLWEQLPYESMGQEPDEPVEQEQATDELVEQPEQTTGKELTDVLQATPKELEKWQLEDPSLQKIQELADHSEGAGDQRVYFYRKGGLVYRRWQPAGARMRDVRQCKQVVLPRQCQALVLRLAHDVPMAGHLGVTKTKDRVLQRYYWPGVFKDVASYCRTC